MAVGSYSVVTVTDEVRLALNWIGTDKIISDAEINRFVIQNITGTRNSYNFDLVTALSTGPNGVYKAFDARPYGLMLWGPTMTCEADCVYLLNARGSITVTSGTPTATSISVTGAVVDFSTVMVQLLHWLATHRCQEIAVSAGSGSMSSAQVHSQLIEMAEYWQGITAIA